MDELEHRKRMTEVLRQLRKSLDFVAYPDEGSLIDDGLYIRAQMHILHHFDSTRLYSGGPGAAGWAWWPRNTNFAARNPP